MTRRCEQSKLWNQRAERRYDAKDYAKREAKLEQTAERLRGERDAAIRAAYEDGLPMATIAKIVGMSHQRVSQIIRS
jgi:DNA-directed RNA polymerase specialized sigma subunit